MTIVSEKNPLCERTWYFDNPHGNLVLAMMEQCDRKSPKDKWSHCVWMANRPDESTMPQPKDIPLWVIREAMSKIKVTVCIGLGDDATAFATAQVTHSFIAVIGDAE